MYCITYSFSQKKKPCHILLCGVIACETKHPFFAIKWWPLSWSTLSAGELSYFRLLYHRSNWSPNESLNHISNHHHGSKIKLPFHQHIMHNSTALCCFERSLVGVFCLLVGWKAYVLRIPTTTKQHLLSCFKRLHLLWSIPVVIWTLDWQGQ